MEGRMIVRQFITGMVALVAVVGGTAVIAAEASTPTVTQTSLAPTTATAGVNVKATLVVHSTGKVSAQAITVAVRDSKGKNVDFPGKHAQVINGTYTYTSGAKSFVAGSYTEFGSYELAGKWHPFASKALKVTAAKPAPKPTPKPTPTPVKPPVTTPPVPTPTPTPTPPVSAGPVGVPGNWKTSFSDEFNGTALNTNVWQPGWFGTGITGPVNSSETHPYSSANVTESGGNLNLALTSTNGALVSSNPDALGTGKGFQYTGPAVLEARVYVPGSGTTVANWPAVWTDGQSWPANGEDDIMEGLGGATAFHVHTNAGGPGKSVNVGPGWHTFASQWNGTAMTFWYDGVNEGTEAWSTNNAPQYIIFDNSSYNGTGPGSGIVPAVMQVDYVREFVPTN